MGHTLSGYGCAARLSRTIAERTTFYGAREAWLELEGVVVLGLAEPS
jgi:hypothetical protein